MKMYKTEGWEELIEEVEVNRVTEKTVFLPWYNGKTLRQARNSSYGNYFDTIEEAKDYLKKKFETQIENAEKRILDAKTNLGLLKLYK